ncbi:MAG: polyphosphate kinase 1, partial [Oscillospiraceae bacterium]|nr:polyphosphate kinase 1 [Oscillospiraceae bacterium]
MNKCYKNREISWLEFNERVLEEAADRSNPLCERLSFASIFQSNLDEFFMVRVGSIHDQMLISEDMRENKTNMTCSEQLEAIMDITSRLSEKKDEVYNEIMNELAGEGVELINFSKLSDDDALYLKKFFKNEIKPLIS